MDDNIRRSESDTDDMPEKPVFKDGDKALDFLRSEAYDGEADAIDEKKLVRKIDFMVVPLMFCCYCLQYLDKSLLNYASHFGGRRSGYGGVRHAVAHLLRGVPCLRVPARVPYATIPSGQVPGHMCVPLGSSRNMYIGMQ